MSETIQIKNPSPLVKTVLALDAHFADLLRLGERLESSELRSNFDHEQAKKLLELFAVAADGVTREVISLGGIMGDIRARAENTAAAVAARAEIIHSRQASADAKVQEFAILAEEVRALNFSLQELPLPQDREPTDDERRRLRDQLGDITNRLRPLIQKATTLRDDARTLKLKDIERNAESLAQKLLTVDQDLRAVSPTV